MFRISSANCLKAWILLLERRGLSFPEARAIFKTPQILLLDEATSHLDIESEKKIKDSLHRFFENVTAVVIAHRLTTLKEMDKIIVLERGKIVEFGRFTELYKSKNESLTILAILGRIKFATENGSRGR